MSRNLSVDEYFKRLGKKITPEYRFAGSDKQNWQKWRDELCCKAKASLGQMPKKVPLNPEIQAEWTEDGLIKQTVVFDVEEDLSLKALVFRPENASGKLPVILACHGHGPFGKDSVMGNDSTAERKENIALFNYDYGLKMAQAGYAVIAIDWRGFGERSDQYELSVDSRDPCNVNFVRAMLIGMTVLGMDVHDGMCALDYMCEQSFVDPERIGVMGLSFGGTMTTWMSICDERIKAADILCYSDRFADFAMARKNTCGSQMSPGLFALCDVPDLHGLIAPRPLLIEIGSYDDCFFVNSAMSCFEEVKKIYSAAGVADKLELDLFDGGHAWGANKSIEFFAKYL